jgi:uncharacterized phage protein (TIGR02220 family)
MRIRTVKPEFWSHPVMAKLSDTTRLCAIGLLNCADDEGYFMASPAIIRCQLWPFSESSVNAHGALSELSNAGWIEVKNHPTHGQVGWVVNFRKHQLVNRPSPSKLKAYFLSESSVNAHGVLSEPSLPEQGTGNREQGARNREQGTREIAPEAQAVLAHLSFVTGKQYRAISEYSKDIMAKLKKVGGDVEGVKAMITRQGKLWMGDPKSEQWVRVSTLFGSKFHEYYDARNAPIPTSTTSSSGYGRNQRHPNSWIGTIADNDPDSWEPPTSYATVPDAGTKPGMAPESGGA